MSFSVRSGVSGPLQRIPPAASCSHTQWAWQYQSRQLPGCWSRSTVIRPSGTSTATVGFASAKGNATYSASLSSGGGFVIRFAMSIHGSSSYSVTTVVTLVHPWSLRSTTRRAPIPGSRSRRADTSSAWLTVRSGAVRSSSRAPPLPKAPCAPPCTYRDRVSPPPRRAVGHLHHVAPRPTRGVEHDAAGAPAPAGAEADPEQRGRDLGVGCGGGAVQEPPLVLPLRDGLRPVGVRSPGRRRPGVLAEQQQIAPHPPPRRGP